MKTKIGKQQVKLLLDIGEYLASGGNIARTVLFNELGLKREDLSRGTTLYQFKSAVKDCTSVVSALQICNSERDKLRDKVNPQKAPKALTDEEMEAKRLREIKENSDYNSHRAMREL